jgi:uncharacterized iron-regulated membrane protein
LLFQVHLWAGVGIGLYVLVICLSGSLLVYRNELFSYFSPQPKIVTGSGRTLSIDALKRAARGAFPNYDVTDVRAGQTQRHAVEITLARGEEIKIRLFHPFTGEDLGSNLPLGFRFTAWVRDLHDNLLRGKTGRRVNGLGALLVILLGVTGAILWWPGIRNWPRSLVIDFRANWKRLNWTLHSALGFWFFGFVLLWGLTGAYLCFPEESAWIFDPLEPFQDDNVEERIVDRIQYWLAYLHFGRLGGRGIPGCGRGLCDSVTKGVWAAAGLVPPVLFVTGGWMWWNRVLRPRIVAQRR